VKARRMYLSKWRITLMMSGLDKKEEIAKASNT
jgi:hypothetical protein